MNKYWTYIILQFFVIAVVYNQNFAVTTLLSLSHRPTHVDKDEKFRMKMENNKKFEYEIKKQLMIRLMIYTQFPTGISGISTFVYSIKIFWQQIYQIW